MSSSLGSSPGAIRYPGHRIEISKNPGRWIASINGTVFADSNETLMLDETRHGRAVYFPRQDVDTARLSESDSRTTCPFKGAARYYAAKIDGGETDIAWFYPAAYEEVVEIAGYVAFYPEWVDVTEDTVHA